MREKQKGERSETAREKVRWKWWYKQEQKEKKQHEQTNEQTIAMCFIWAALLKLLFNRAGIVNRYGV